MLVLPFPTWSKSINELKMVLKLQKSKTIKSCLSKLKWHRCSKKKVFENKKNEKKNWKGDPHCFKPSPLAPFFFNSAPIYQLSSPSPLPPTYLALTLYPPPVVYQPHQQHLPMYSPNPPANCHQQNRPPTNPARNSNKISHNFTPLLDTLSPLLPKLLNPSLITRAQPRL